MTDIFGEAYAAQYDLLYRGKDYDAECAALERIFRADAPFEVRHVLDLGCGTGSHSLRLARRGYRVTGVDASPAMLEVARAKAADLGAGEAPAFVHSDLARFRGGFRADAALMMFAVLGYLASDEELTRALAGVRLHLRDGGLFVFDVWYAPAVEAIEPSAREVVLRSDAEGELRRRVSAKLDRRRRICEVAIELELERSGERRRLASEVHRMRYFDRPELESRLATAGLDLIRLGAFPDPEQLPDATTWNVLGVARASAA